MIDTLKNVGIDVYPASVTETDEADQLERELVEARDRITLLENSQDSGDQTLIGSMRDPDELTDGRDASNDAVDDGITETGYNEKEEFEFEELVAPAAVLDPDDDHFHIDELADEAGDVGERVVRDEDKDVDEDVDEVLLALDADPPGAFFLVTSLSFASFRSVDCTFLSIL